MKPPPPDQRPDEGYHWFNTDRREKRVPQTEIVYVHHRSDGDCDLFVFFRSLPLTWNEVVCIGPAVDPGPTAGSVAQVEPFAPVQLSALDRRQGVRSIAIPGGLHRRAYAAYATKWGNSQSSSDIARRGGFGASELDEFAPGWRDSAVAKGSHDV